MKRARHSISSFRLSIRVWIVLLGLAAGSLLVTAAPPPWWVARSVTDPGKPADDYAVANQGQLKNMALAAFNEMEAKLPGRAGPDLTNFVNTWTVLQNKQTRQRVPKINPSTDDFAVVNLGQLKNVATLFYNRLIESGIANSYPWSTTLEADDFASANLGQLKNVFSFNVGIDSDGDGLGDAWELAYLGTLAKGAGDSAGLGNGTLLEAFQHGRIPTFYGNELPILTIVSGDGQGAEPGFPLPAPIVIRVTNRAGIAYKNVPIDFYNVDGEITAVGGISPSPHYVRVKTNQDGNASARAVAPSTVGTFEVVLNARPGPQPVRANYAGASASSEPEIPVPGNTGVQIPDPEIPPSGAEFAPATNASISGLATSAAGAVGLTLTEFSGFVATATFNVKTSILGAANPGIVDYLTPPRPSTRQLPGPWLPWPPDPATTRWFLKETVTSSHTGSLPSNPELGGFEGKYKSEETRYRINWAIPHSLPSTFVGSSTFSDSLGYSVESQYSDGTWSGDLPFEPWRSPFGVELYPLPGSSSTLIGDVWAWEFDSGRQDGNTHSELAEEYARDLFARDVIAALPPVGPPPPIGLPIATRRMERAGAGFTAGRAEYTLTVPRYSLPQKYQWYEVWQRTDDPDTDGVDESQATPILTRKEWKYDGINRTSSTFKIYPESKTVNGDWRLLLPVEMMVDANRDGTIDDSDRGKVSEKKPWSFWLNDNDDQHTDPLGPQAKDWDDGHVNDAKDLNDFFPVFLDIQQVVKALPPSQSIKYKLKQADNAVNFVETHLARDRAFSYLDPAEVAGYGFELTERAPAATTTEVTAVGVELSERFLGRIRDNNEGVILIEGRKPTTKPLVLTVENGGVQVAEVSLPLSLAPRILLLLHGMNSNTDTWNDFADAAFPDDASLGTSAVRSLIIRNNVFVPSAISVTLPRFNRDRSLPPSFGKGGVRCYRLQFGSPEDEDTARTGLLGDNGLPLTTMTAKGGIDGTLYPYLEKRQLKCGDFESFGELAKEVDTAITMLHTRHPEAQIVLLGHSRGGLAGRKFLEGAFENKKYVAGFLTTSSLHKGSQMGRVYQWLADHPRHQYDGNGQEVMEHYTIETENRPIDMTRPVNERDWSAVDFLRAPSWPFSFYKTKETLDVRRPVIMDMADSSNAIAELNNAGQVSNLPPKAMYGEIIYNKVDLGVLVREPRYSVFDNSHTLLTSLCPTLSNRARTSLLDGQDPASLTGDGLIPGEKQWFTGLPGFPAPGYPPSDDPNADKNTIWRLQVRDRDVVHTEAPAQVNDLRAQLRLLVPSWFP